MEISGEIIIAVLGFLGSMAGSLGGMNLMKYQIEELSKRVDKHNQVVERVYRLEENEAVQDEKIRVVNHRLADLERGAEHED